jgi:hypothetical protein
MAYRILDKYTLTDGFYFFIRKNVCKKRKPILSVIFRERPGSNTCFPHIANTLQSHCNHIASTIKFVSKSYQSRTKVVPKSYQSRTKVVPKSYQSRTKVVPSSLRVRFNFVSGSSPVRLCDFYGLVRRSLK